MNVISKRLAALAFAALGAVLLPQAALAVDRVELRDGSVIFGTFKDADAGKITLETAFAGTLEIDQAEVVAMRVASDLVLQMEDGAVLETPELTVAGEELKLDPAAAPTRYALADLTRINPEPWELGRGYNFTGLGSVALASQRGNTDTDEFNYRLDANFESLKDRYRFEGFGEINEAQGTKNAENWTLRGRYDRNQTGDWYWGVGGLVQQDTFADLDLRTSIGPYVGRKFFTEPRFEFEAEGGLSYVTEDFSTAEDREYIGATWSAHARSNILGGDSRLYLDHNGILNLDEAENVVLNTTIGVAFPLVGGIEGAAEVMWNINTGAVAGTEEVDQAYRFRLGYSW